MNFLIVLETPKLFYRKSIYRLMNSIWDYIYIYLKIFSQKQVISNFFKNPLSYAKVVSIFNMHFDNQYYVSYFKTSLPYYSGKLDVSFSLYIFKWVLLIYTGLMLIFINMYISFIHFWSLSVSVFFFNIINL